MNPKILLKAILLVLFFGSIAYFFFVFSFNLISGPGWTDDLESALVIAGLSIGFLFVLREKTTPDLSPPEGEEEGQENEDKKDIS